MMLLNNIQILIVEVVRRTTGKYFAIDYRGVGGGHNSPDHFCVLKTLQLVWTSHFFFQRISRPFLHITKKFSGNKQIINYKQVVDLVVRSLLPA